KADQESRLTLGGENAHRVCGGAEVGGMAQRRQAGVSEQDVEAHGEDRHDRHLGEQREGIRRQRWGDDGRRDERGDADDDRAASRALERGAHTRPKRPVGLSARISAIGANSVKYDSSGKSALPKLSRRPTSSEPTMAPGSEPSPPTITTTKA